MTTVKQSEWTNMFTKIQHYQQNQIVHQLDGNKNDR